MIGLRFSMYSLGGLLFAVGLIAALMPDRIVAFAGRGSDNVFLLGAWGWVQAVLGLGILQAGRDPLRNILWVRIGILTLMVGAAYDLYHYLNGDVIFGVVAPDLAAGLVFGLLFLVFYPRAPRMASLGVHTTRGVLYTDVDRGGLFLRQGKSWIAYFLPAQEPPVPVKVAPAAPEIMAPPTASNGAAPQTASEAPTAIPADHPVEPPTPPGTPSQESNQERMP